MSESPERNDEGQAAEPADGRCVDYCNDPAVIYHAHDLPRCKNVCTVQIDGRWLCNTHARLATAESSLALLTQLVSDLWNLPIGNRSADMSQRVRNALKSQVDSSEPGAL